MTERNIPLTRGQVAVVDSDDYESLSAWKWHAHWDATTRSFYAQRAVSNEGSQRWITMHREILGLQYGDKRYGDHINHDTLDNRRSNLRIVTARESNCNRRLRRDSQSGVAGVSFYKPTGMWGARINIGGKRKSLGYRKSKEEAIALRINAETEHYGEFACAKS